MNNILIVSGGNVDKNVIKEEVEEEYATIIAVDKGIEALEELDIIPTHIIGDFDSVDKDILNKYIDTCRGGFSYLPIIHKLKENKDYTDTNMAMKLALKLDPEEITLICATGDRMDHTISNIQDMVMCLEKNVKCKILDKNNEIFIINKNTIIKNDKKYKYVSLIPLTTEVSGISLKGFKYELTNHTLKIGENIGISNEQIENEAEILLTKGILIVIKSKDWRESIAYLGNI